MRRAGEHGNCRKVSREIDRFLHGKGLRVHLRPTGRLRRRARG